MSSTQEKQEHKCHWRAYGQPDGTVVCDECNTAADVNKLIDSAKREGAIEELKKLLDFPVAVTPNAHFGYDDMVFLDDIKDRIAQLEQSEESK